MDKIFISVFIKVIGYIRISIPVVLKSCGKILQSILVAFTIIQLKGRKLYR